MFDGLSGKLTGIFDKLRGRGALSEADVGEAMREVRRALLEADVALDVVRDFTDKVRARAVGVEVLKSVTPGQMVVKIVQDVADRDAGLGCQRRLIWMLCRRCAILMVGLQGSGKTTTTAKIAKRLTDKRNKKKVLDGLARYAPSGRDGAAGRAGPR